MMEVCWDNEGGQPSGMTGRRVREISETLEVRPLFTYAGINFSQPVLFHKGFGVALQGLLII